MFGILLNEENLPKIYDALPDLTETDKHGVETYLALRGTSWYFIRGWVSERGGVPINTVLPEYRLKLNYEYDAEKIKTDWDQIVRK